MVLALGIKYCSFNIWCEQQSDVFAKKKSRREKISSANLSKTGSEVKESKTEIKNTTAHTHIAC